ncbi:hypothetical protein HDU98_001711 [Podochytrium sp. JEL0797]|nr:hypothetical protein HDU98_001711 [Podochytrium sp. JEL0797]
MPQQSTDPVTIVVSLVILFFVLRYLLAPAEASANPQLQQGTRAASAGGRPRRQQAVSQAKVDAVLSMFPNYPRHIIEQDLARTGSVEMTLENILSGALPAPPPPAPTASSSSSIPSTFSPSPYLTPTVLDPSSPEPAKVWEQTAKGRELNLRARKEHMVRVARERMEREKAKAEEEAKATAAAGSN